MPLTEYTEPQKATLDAFTKIDNFRSKTYTLFNNKTGDVVPDAISIDQNGKLIIKDKHTELVITDIIERKNYISEKQDTLGNDILYFEDEFNERISLGEMYANIQRFLNSNLIFWFNGRAEQNLEGGMDTFIIEDVFDSYKELNVNDETTVKNYVTQQYDHWKNKWHDVPCMQVETPAYVSGKYANISAKIVMTVRCDKPLYTGFRIVDATTGFELSRTIHASKGQHGKPITYTIPLSYQGPLPDSDLPVADISNVLTYKDIANVTVNGEDGTFKTTPVDQSLTVGVPINKHLIKLQWITCDYASEVMKDGEVLESLFRDFDPLGVTSLDVSIYSKTSNDLETSEINGTISFDDVTTEEFYYTFEEKPFGIPKDYSLMVSANKNVNISVIHKSQNGFVIKTNRKIAGLVIDWSITYYIDNEAVDDVLNDANRTANHHLFRKRDEVLDFCQELLKTGTLPATPPSVWNAEGRCECCDCCTDDEVRVIYELIDIAPPPHCNLAELFFRIENDNAGGIDEYLGGVDELGLGFDADSRLKENVTLRDALESYLLGEDVCGPVTFPFSTAEDSLGARSYSFDLKKKFQYLARISVIPGSEVDNRDASGEVPGTGGYDFFEDLFTDKGLAEEVTMAPPDPSPSSPQIKDYSGIPFFKKSFGNCTYSFDHLSIVSTKIVENKEVSSVYQLLKSELLPTCNIPYFEDEVIEVEILEQPPITDSFPLKFATFYRPPIYASFNSLFSVDLLFSGLDNNSLNELKENMKLLNDAKQDGLLKLEHDRLRNVNDLPVQLLSNNTLRLDFPRNDNLDVYFESPQSDTLYTSNGSFAKTRINPEEGFLSIKAFRHNIIAFDPRPGILFTEETTPFFPTFNPIYNQKSYDQLLEYIYTAIYPTENVPVFPNFRVGEFVVNGAQYNPLYDYRNYRTFGFYQSFTDDTNQQLFISDPVSLSISSLQIGRFINIGDEYYQMRRDFNNSGPILTNITSSGTVQKVKPSGIIFKKIPKELYDLNPLLQVSL